MVRVQLPVSLPRGRVLLTPGMLEWILMLMLLVGMPLLPLVLPPYLLLPLK